MSGDVQVIFQSLVYTSLGRDLYEEIWLSEEVRIFLIVKGKGVWFFKVLDFLIHVLYFD